MNHPAIVIAITPRGTPTPAPTAVPMSSSLLPDEVGLLGLEDVLELLAVELPVPGAPLVDVPVPVAPLMDVPVPGAPLVDVAAAAVVLSITVVITVPPEVVVVTPMIVTVENAAIHTC
jgi:hypothetical protein